MQSLYRQDGDMDLSGGQLREMIRQHVRHCEVGDRFTAIILGDERGQQFARSNKDLANPRVFPAFNTGGRMNVHKLEVQLLKQGLKGGVIASRLRRVTVRHLEIIGHIRRTLHKPHNDTGKRHDNDEVPNEDDQSDHDKIKNLNLLRQFDRVACGDEKTRKYRK